MNIFNSYKYNLQFVSFLLAVVIIVISSIVGVVVVICCILFLRIALYFKYKLYEPYFRFVVVFVVVFWVLASQLFFPSFAFISSQDTCIISSPSNSHSTTLSFYLFRSLFSFFFFNYKKKRTNEWKEQNEREREIALYASLANKNASKNELEI